MSDHAMLGWLVLLAITMEIGGFVVLVAMLRESQRLTRAVAAMVYQESDKTRAAITGRARFED